MCSLVDQCGKKFVACRFGLSIEPAQFVQIALAALLLLDLRQLFAQGITELQQPGLIAIRS